MKLRTGTSGFSYKEWKGSFYPEALPQKEMLAYYGERLPAVEINNTFYRLPKRQVLENWAASVPETFRFSIKASRRITHFKKLKGAGEELDYLLQVLEALGPKLGVVLFQLPPYLRKGEERLADFLEELSPDTPAAFEFRHPSWYQDDVFDLLRGHGCALCVADTGGDDDAPLVSTAPFGYLRLRRPGYCAEELDAWARRIREQEWEEVFVFFKHEDEGAGPEMASSFLELAGREGEE